MRSAGAETSVTPFNLPTSSAGSDLLTAQLPLFASAHATADPNALYTIWIGSNDLNGIFTNATPAQYGSDIGLVAGNIDTAISTLAGLGAIGTFSDPHGAGPWPISWVIGGGADRGRRGIGAYENFRARLLVNGSGPDSVAFGDRGGGRNRYFGPEYPTHCGTRLPGEPNLGVRSHKYAHFQPCLTGEVNYSGGTPCATPNQYLFWDTDHPTAAGHEIVANAALSVVTPEPGSISLIAVGILGLVIFRRRCCQTR